MREPSPLEQFTQWLLGEYAVQLYLAFYFFSLVLIGWFLVRGTNRQFPPLPRPLKPRKGRGDPPILPPPGHPHAGA